MVPVWERFARRLLDTETVDLFISGSSARMRDIIERYAVSHPVALRHLTRHLLGNAAGLFSVHRFYNYLKSQGIPGGWRKMLRRRRGCWPIAPQALLHDFWNDADNWRP